MSTPIGKGFRGPEGRVGYLLRQAQQAMAAAIADEIRDIGLTAPQYSILSAVRHEPGVTATEVAENSMLRQQTVNEMIQALERAGLVERRRDETDRRALLIELTADGKRTLREADRRVAKLERRTRQRLDDAEWRLIAEWLVDCAQTFADQRPVAKRRAA